jgi:hypothetical protein
VNSILRQSIQARRRHDEQVGLQDVVLAQVHVEGRTAQIAQATRAHEGPEPDAELQHEVLVSSRRGGGHADELPFDELMAGAGLRERPVIVGRELDVGPDHRPHPSALLGSTGARGA